MSRLAVLGLAAAACSSAPAQRAPGAGPAGAGTGSDAPVLGALPAPRAVNTERFAGVIVCDRCHTAGAEAMRDGRGRDISPVAEVRVSMMGLAARDPYYLAALAREIAANPGAKAQIEAICLRCHAPVGMAEAGGALTLGDLVAGAGDAAALGREGVGCAGCHALDPDGLGQERTLSRPALREDRISFGALEAPLAEAMVAMSKTRPERGAHVSQSRLCASCHTVLVRRLDERGAPVGDEIAEQATYLEWRNSAFQDEAQPAGARATTCQGCHMPATEDELGRGPPIATAFSTRPPDAPVRERYRRHALRGGNAYLLERLAANAAWINAGVTAEELAGAAAATREFLRRAARLELAGGRDALAVTVVNETGHKLPTGYPSRRMWLHVVARDDRGEVVFESGRFDPRSGALLDRAGRRIDGPDAILPHRTAIGAGDATDLPIVWEAVPVDPRGKRTHLLLGTAGFAKDNRILPAGWRADHPDAARTRAIGTGGDPDFAPGRDTVTFRLPASARTVHAQLLYQPIPPETIESYDPRDGPEAARFRRITAEPPLPHV
ncbi:MAG TPA: hypothetical protein VK932_16365, partial [Kofleriaceae bacterium]|nr:hypothetical protein [Kofleriaceae bacterium]